MLEISRGNLFDLLTNQGSVFSTVFVVTLALAYGCVNTNLFVVPVTEQLHIQTLVWTLLVIAIVKRQHCNSCNVIASSGFLWWYHHRFILNVKVATFFLPV